jgi:sialate O-acetylesterase
MNKYWISFLFVQFMALPSSFAQLKLADIFTDHMVIQQQSQLEIYGWAVPGASVTVSCSWTDSVTPGAFADQSGKWRTQVQTPAASLTPLQIAVVSGADSIILDDVLAGEVWLCSGQSNMEWSTSDSHYDTRQLRGSDYSHIRHFKVQHAVELAPRDYLVSSGWEICNDESVQHYSAVAYFFARELADKLGIPVGLVNSSWGGSQIESWISGEGMASSPLFRKYMENFPRDWAEADARSMKKIADYALGFNKKWPSAAAEAAYTDPGFDISGWKTARPVLAWDWQNLWAFRGTGFMATDITLGESAASEQSLLHLGHADLDAGLYVNGVLVWSGKNLGGASITLAPGVFRSGNNRIVYKQKLNNATGWVEMGMRGPDSDFYLRTSEGTVSLAGDWRVMPSFNDPYYFVHSSNNLGTAIYNAMIHPLAGYPLQGVIWYQGESNAARAYEYRESFPLLIRDWRRIWKREIPFLFVQLANYEAGGGTSATGSEWAELREAQEMALRLPATGMAVTIDIGESKDIHPKNKYDVGVRLAHEAMRVAYQSGTLPGSPVEPRVKFCWGHAKVKYRPEYELMTTDKYGYVNGFELAGCDGQFKYARAVIKNNHIVVKADTVRRPVALRFAWADDPDDFNLFTSAGKPVAPFRTDKRKSRTEGIKFDTMR